MLQKIRTSKAAKVVVCYLSMMLVIESVQPLRMYAITSGPTQPEFNSFTPISTSDMVDLASGDFNYNIPIMDVGGYPLNLSYNSTVTMDQESSWTGLGWNLNVGQIQRQVRGLPDDFNGDEMRYQNDLKENITVGANFNFQPAFFGADELMADGSNPSTDEAASYPISLGIGVQYNNYEGISFKPSFGVSFALSENVSVGANFSSSVADGASVSPSVSVSGIVDKTNKGYTTMSGGFGVEYNSRKGVENLTMSASAKSFEKFNNAGEYRNKEATGDDYEEYNQTGGGGTSGSLSFNTQSYTPTKRVAYDNRNFTFKAGLGYEVTGHEGQGQITGYGSFQKINSAYRNRLVKAFGYENTQYKNGQEGVLDFNREKEQIVSTNTTALPVTNYTYDIYSINGQGASGMFRPYRSQVAHVFNDKVTDNSVGISAGVEIGAGNLVHVGFNFLMAPSKSFTGKWIHNNGALIRFNESSNDVNSIFYEPTNYKLVGELDVDKEMSLYYDKVHDNKAVRLKLEKSTYDNKTMSVYEVKNHPTSANPNTYTDAAINSKIKRTKRYLRNQNVQKVTWNEAGQDKMITRASSAYAKPHHTAGMKVLQADGTTYVYGRAVYNTKKVEATFDVSSKSGSANKRSEILGGITDATANESAHSDQYLNKITTPAYAHSYLITSILSADYEDLTGDGPTDDDLGSYTKFEYQKPNGPTNVYKWRTPYASNEVAFNEGLKSHSDDEKGNYIYGEKELVYLSRIITKTHVAVFTVSQKNDARAAKEELGNGSGITPDRSYKLDKIDLYSFEEYAKTNRLTPSTDDDQPLPVPIKTAHFDYSYRLCKGTTSNLQNGKGKLTLERVYLTYRNSKMGQYTPYVFDYGTMSTSTSDSSDGSTNPDVLSGDKIYALHQSFYPDTKNPVYDAKAVDMWGNYKLNQVTTASANLRDTLSNAEFPFVRQENTHRNSRKLADANAAVWVLKKITLPSGGSIDIEVESDDYQYVQDRKAMQMFMVNGAGNNPATDNLKNAKLYIGSSHYDYLYVNLGVKPGGYDDADFKTDYLDGIINKPIYFRFLLSMYGDQNSPLHDYVSGYFEINQGKDIVMRTADGNTYAAIPVKMLKRGGGVNPNNSTNPIAKAGWGFGRTYLNRVVYGSGTSNNSSFVSIVRDLVGSITAMRELFLGPNKVLESKGCAKYFNGNKSWIRLQNPDGHKLGGGLRVKSVRMHDNWNIMATGSDDASLYEQTYGQTYDYNLDDAKHTSSGVATFEPNGSPENPFVEPFYPKEGNYGDRISSPREQNYIEKPFGENFFPSPKVTYSRVTVSNLQRSESGSVVKRHATGKVVTEHYTSKDFPTIVDYTNLDMQYDPPLGIMSFFDIVSINHLAATQGYSIETNDMDGKIKKQSVYAEDNDQEPISWVWYKYSVDANGKLDNELTTIDRNGAISEKLIGVEYDMINDFNESNSDSKTLGFDGNLAVIASAGPIPIFVPSIFPRVAYHESILRTAVTTKVIHKTAVMTEKIAYDLGSTVATKSLAWDADTGDVLLTKTTNEFNDSYYSFNYPAYWHYELMGLASENIDISGILYHAPQTYPDKAGYKLDAAYGITDMTTVFRLGDELDISRGMPTEIILNGDPDTEDEMLQKHTKAWVVGFSSDKSQVYLMDRGGDFIDPCGFNSNPIPFKIMRSGNRNLQKASMASVVSVSNPLDVDNDGIDSQLPADLFAFDTADHIQFDVINASAVTYNDFWRTQEEYNKYYPADETQSGGNINADGSVKFPETYLVNPYVHNIKGDWRANNSYAYLTGRKTAETTRKAGYFSSYHPYYKLDGDMKWIVNPLVGTPTNPAQRWTTASTVTKFSPHGMELENEDALHRFSSAQYGYKEKLPMAVASNSKYQEMMYEGFEESVAVSPTVTTYGNKRFGFKDDNDELVQTSDLQAHTGRKSIPVAAGTEVTMTKSLGEATGEVRDDYRCIEHGIVCPPTIVGPNLTVNSNDPRIFCMDVDGPYHYEFIIDFGSDGPAANDPIAFFGLSGGIPDGYSIETNPLRIVYDWPLPPWPCPTCPVNQAAYHTVILTDGTGTEMTIQIRYNAFIQEEGDPCRNINIVCVP